MRKRQLRTIAKSMHTLHKKSSDIYKKSCDLGRKAEEEFWELVIRLSEKYNCKIVLDENDGWRFPKEVLEYNFIWRDKNILNKIDCTSFNIDFVGEFIITFAGKLSIKEMNEIKNLTGCCNVEKKSEPNGFYSYYIFYFDFDNYWNEGYQ